MLGAHTDLRIVLIGRAGAGKSSTGNTILGREMFRENVFTRVCRMRKAAVGQRTIKVIDTPGVFDPVIRQAELNTEIKRCVQLSAPGPHVFLLVIRLDMRLTEEEKNAVTWIQENFEEEAACYTFVLFTRCDLVVGEPLNVIRQYPDFHPLINRCGGRYYLFNNNERGKRDQVTGLIEQIDRMVQSNRGYYNIPQRDDDFGLYVGMGIATALAGLLVAMMIRR